ncbi:MAG TPA: carboxypeptidase-like regulatory domain-containing protein [Planctomycetota bacterium]|nr:carboxypeptidase-like regulatory domain-containing protein [Planctomycetota bacterium]
MLAAFAATLALQVSLPAAPLYEMSGRLVDPDGVPIGRARLELSLRDGSGTVVFESELDGSWRAEGLSEGRWLPRLQHFGPELGDVRFEPAELVVPGPPVVLTAFVAHLSTGPGMDDAYCTQLPDLELGVLERGEGWRFEDSRNVWLVRRDARSVVGHWSRAHGLSEVEHTFGSDDPWGARVRPTLGEVAEPGRVELVIPKRSGNQPVSMLVLSPRSRHELESVRAEGGLEGSGTWTFRATLPPGEYLLRIVEDDPVLFCLLPGDTTWERRVLRPIEVEVRVAGGADVLLECDWEDGVRPTFAFDAPGARAVFVWELDAQGRLTRPVGCEPQARGLVLGELLAWQSDGRAHSAREPLPLGRIRLVAGADGFAPRTFELDLVEGLPCVARIELAALAPRSSERR